MRKLNTTDVFAFTRLIKGAELRSALQKIAVTLEAGADIESVGIDTIATVLEALSTEKSEREIYGFLSGPFECTPDDVALMELDVLISKLRQLAEENNLSRFFNSASGILGKH